jgi:hypothetical protein
MISDELAIEVARLGLITESSPVAALRRLTDLAPRAIPGCAGATAVRWHQGEPLDPVVIAASHPELGALVDLQLDQGQGPILDAIRTGDEVHCDDTLAEPRWPGCTAAMLRRGVRCFHTLVSTGDGVQMSFTAYGVMPGAMDAGSSALAALLAAQGGAAVSNTRRYGDAHRTAVQLREAVASRAVVDQAKGILMHALGYDADEAFKELRRISQTRHVKLTALARKIVSGQPLPLQQGDQTGQGQRSPSRRPRD